jgi:hypothetical protein
VTTQRSREDLPDHSNEWLALAFEMSSAWLSFCPVDRILRSVEGVSDVKRNLLFARHERPLARAWSRVSHPRNQ